MDKITLTKFQHKWLIQEGKLCMNSEVTDESQLNDTIVLEMYETLYDEIIITLKNQHVYRRTLKSPKGIRYQVNYSLSIKDFINWEACNVHDEYDMKLAPKTDTEKLAGCEELLSEAQSHMDNTHGYGTEIYKRITKYFEDA